MPASTASWAPRSSTRGTPSWPDRTGSSEPATGASWHGASSRCSKPAAAKPDGPGHPAQPSSTPDAQRVICHTRNVADGGRTSLRMRETVADDLGAPDAPLPAVRSTDLRRHLPGVEPERQLNDWGRSERVEGIYDRYLLEFYYRYWFRCEVEGVENVPSSGGALLVSNHSGALPPDAAMIGKAIKEEHTHPRALNVTVEHFFKGYPGFSMLLPKIGCVAAHPANVHRLLYDEEQLVLVFPEGRK